jgi:hypothetical protein
MNFIGLINGYVSTHKAQILAVAGAPGTVAPFVPPPHNAIPPGIAAVLALAAAGSAAHARIAVR